MSMMSYHAYEDVSGRIQWLDGRGAHRKLHEPGDLAHEALHDAPVVQDADNCAEVDDNREHLQQKGTMRDGHGSMIWRWYNVYIDQTEHITYA